MKNMRNIVAAIVMVTVLSVSTTFAADGIIIAGKDGIIIAGKAEQRQKTSSCSESRGIRGAIMVATGIIIAGFTGIIIAGAADNTQTNCGIIIAG